MNVIGKTPIIYSKRKEVSTMRYQIPQIGIASATRSLIQSGDKTKSGSNCKDGGQVPRSAPMKSTNKALVGDEGADNSATTRNCSIKKRKEVNIMRYSKPYIALADASSQLVRAVVRDKVGATCLDSSHPVNTSAGAYM